ncbi:TPA: hypothetical protein SL793_006260 [Pseudomonas aeruginosa]|nr:hypothetical protein [Pseudomonas aeruginosa]HEJ5404739.1 hypothetical protein [Pseudomonas aeruginosa]HEJ5820795.1 hypothetical protein [Pseudomonas aeruginosa]
MTNPIVLSISDEQLAELADGCIDSIPCPISALYELAERLIAAEADVKRYRWLCASAWYVGPEPCGDIEAVSWHDHNETMGGVTEAIDKAIAMERTP